MSASSQTRSYGSGARILSVGIASTGLLTLAYFSISSHVLGEEAASRIALLWSVMFVIISVIYRPIEQLLSRTIAERRARGKAEHPLRVPIAIQAGFALTFLVIALALRGTAGRRRVRPLPGAVRRARVRDARLRRQLLRARLAGGTRILRAVRRPGADGVGLAPVLRAGGGARDHERPDGPGAGDRGRAAGVADRRAGRVRAARRRNSARRSTAQEVAAHEADEALAGPVTADEVDAAFAGTGHRGRAGGGGARGRALAAPRHGLRGLGLGDHALRADAAERGRADGRGDRPEQSAGGRRLRRAADRARAAAAVSGDPDLAAAAPDGPGDDRWPRRVRARDPR